MVMMMEVGRRRRRRRRGSLSHEEAAVDTCENRHWIEVCNLIGKEKE